MAQRLLTVSVFFIISLNSNVSADVYSDETKRILKNIISDSKGAEKYTKDNKKIISDQVDDYTPSNFEIYDYIVVGGGTAGAVVAARLSELQNERVLVIEEGGKEYFIMDIPFACPLLISDENIFSTYLSPPSKTYCLGNENNQCLIMQGRSLGGGGAVNYILTTRGTKKDYDGWAKHTGDKTWSYDRMLKYFKKLERCDINLTMADPKYRNFDGPIRIAEAEYRSPLSKAFIEAGQELGFDAPIDYNGEKRTGFAYMQTNQIHGERLTSNRAYLNPIKWRKNLHVSMNSKATKILISPLTKTAYGVKFIKNGKTIRVIARKEVIVSAGAIGSPKLLMLSGIGPSKELKSLGIPVIQDAPVGENLMDHIAYLGLAFFVNSSIGFVMSELYKVPNDNVDDYLLYRKGPLTSPNAIENVAYVNIDDPSPHNEDPNIGFLFSAAHIGSGDLLYHLYKMRESYFNESFGDSLFHHAYTIWPILMNPKSRGKVYLASADPKVDPIVVPNYYSHPDDIKTEVKAIRFAIKISETQALQKYGSVRHKLTVPGCHQYEDDSDDFWECASKTYVQSFAHISGTCKMGKLSDPTTVVNSKLQVKGIRNLRVADTSIMPMIPTATTFLPAVAIGEKASDIIKSYWGYRVA